MCIFLASKIVSGFVAERERKDKHGFPCFRRQRIFGQKCLFKKRCLKRPCLKNTFWKGLFMSSFKEHSIYSYMSEPLRIVGITMDEWGLGATCLIMCFAFESMLLKSLFALLAPSSVYVVKKLKKLAVGFSLVSFLHWRLGLRFGVSPCVPCSWKRRFWG